MSFLAIVRLTGSLLDFYAWPQKTGQGRGGDKLSTCTKICLSLHNALNTLPVGYATTFYTGRLQTLTLKYTISDKKGTPFVYLLLTNATSFTYL